MIAVKSISAASVDELVLAGIAHVIETGEYINARAGAAIQSYNVAYTLTDSTDRVFHLRHPASERYLCRELLAFFAGSLRVTDGLLQASEAWARYSDSNGLIWSNYGHYVFYQRVGGKTQYEWILAVLSENPSSRRAVINVNQPHHKDPGNLDFPCAIAVQFYVRSDLLHCCVLSRSEDLYSGLPYDIAFFSFLNELIASDLGEKLGRPVFVGPTTVLCMFTQIYEKNRAQLQSLLEKPRASSVNGIRMPEITNASQVLRDIYTGSAESAICRWIRRHADFQ
jgi:thymidylate synthase